MGQNTVNCDKEQQVFMLTQFWGMGACIQNPLQLGCLVPTAGPEGEFIQYCIIPSDDAWWSLFFLLNREKGLISSFFHMAHFLGWLPSPIDTPQVDTDQL